MSSIRSSGLVAALHADGPAGEVSGTRDFYGFLVGDWDTEIVTHAPDGDRHQGRGEIHAGWILEGRAIQDVWMIPRRRDRRPDGPILPLAGNWYGTTVRVYDAVLGAWRITWIDPVTNSHRQQIGRRLGTDIVQQGVTAADAHSRWSFTDIASDTFHWRAETSTDQGASWQLFVEVFAKRGTGERGEG